MFELQSLGWLPLVIFAARVVDVSLGTMRIIFIARGRKFLAPLFGFFEVFIWVSVISQIIRGPNNLIAYIAYASGFAVGNYVGMILEDRLAIGMLVVRAILPGNIDGVTKTLASKGFGFTTLKAQGSQGPVNLIYTVVRRKDLRQVADILEKEHPKAFFTVEELRSVERGVFPRIGIAGKF